MEIASRQGGGADISLEDLAREIASRHWSRLFIVAIVGAPGSGKSTKTEALQSLLSWKYGVKTQILPMDGFHYDNQVLKELDLLAKKGAPETFDVGGLEAIIKRLSESQEQAVAVPVFDREADLARAGGRIVHADTQVLLVEGNYLLLRSEPWVRLHRYFDLTVMLACNEDVLRSRLMQRWLDLSYSKDQASQKIESNDLPNARRVLAETIPTDFTLVS
jgi:pantothenate kinase